MSSSELPERADQQIIPIGFWFAEDLFKALKKVGR